ncbi:MAG: hypothetical protein RLZZ214_2495, partial [Verrucomicrobiota bacterium]
DQSAVALDEQQLDFTQAADAITLQSNVLSEKRNKREQLIKYLKNSELSTEITEELEATLQAIDIRISLEFDALLRTEDEILQRREKIEQAAPIAHQKELEAISLRDSYAKALE